MDPNEHPKEAGLYPKYLDVLKKVIS